ncbi:MAG TPA: helix-turn-helix domain-containing protein [Niabella sp.]|nr:helix-turn-helix domain-containing protein [Niabella sp.]
MESILIPGEKEIKQWIKEAICEYFQMAALPQNESENEEPLLSRKQIVKHLDDISLVTLHAWMKQGLPYHKQEGRVYFLKSEVFEYIKSKKDMKAEQGD